MFNKSKKFLLSKRRATGGLMFVMMATIGALTLSSLTKLSSEDLTKSMVNESAYFATFRAATYLYNSHAPNGSYTVVNDTRNHTTINMLSDFNSLLDQSFDHKCSHAGGFTVQWNRGTSTATTTYIGPVVPNFTYARDHRSVTADTQVIVIE